MRLVSIRPHCGPSCGGTMLTLIGTGLTETNKVKARFIVAPNKFIVTFILNNFNTLKEAKCHYDAVGDNLRCITPDFESIQGITKDIWPLEV